MGNSQGQEKFDPNFNMEQYNKKLQAIRGQYSQHQVPIDAPGYSVQKPKSNIMGFHTISRKSAIHKPSIDIIIEPQNVKVHFKYDSQVECNIELCFGVKGVLEDPAKRTISIDCAIKDNNSCGVGKKVDFMKNLSLPGINPGNMSQFGIIIRIINQVQITQYTLTYVFSQKHWKVTLQKYQNAEKVCHLQDVYSGGEGGQDCIICMSQHANTMVKPCKHLCLCKQCAETMRGNIQTCPICRRKIFEIVTIAGN